MGVVVYFIFHHEKFHFEVTPAKKCSLGPYMTQSGQDHELCKDMWGTPKGRDRISRYSCLNGDCGLPSGLTPSDKPLKDSPLPGNPFGQGQYLGLPLRFEYSPMSNALWKNEMCSSGWGSGSPSVL